MSAPASRYPAQIARRAVGTQAAPASPSVTPPRANAFFSMPPVLPNPAGFPAVWIRSLEPAPLGSETVEETIQARPAPGEINFPLSASLTAKTSLDPALGRSTRPDDIAPPAAPAGPPSRFPALERPRLEPLLPVHARLPAQGADPAAPASQPSGSPAQMPALEPARPAVRLEPSARPALFIPPAEPNRELPTAADGPEARGAPALLHMRYSSAPVKREVVRVSIGRVDIHVEAERPAPPVANIPRPSGDPFVTLALARRGWRANY